MLFRLVLRINRANLIKYQVRYESLSSVESRDYREQILLTEQLNFYNQCSERAEHEMYSSCSKMFWFFFFLHTVGMTESSAGINIKISVKITKESRRIALDYTHAPQNQSKKTNKNQGGVKFLY